MADVAQALRVPSALPEFDIGGLLSALLVWDRVLIPSNQAWGPAHSQVREELDPLVEAGACEYVELPAPELKSAALFQASEAEDLAIEEAQLDADPYVAGVDAGARTIIALAAEIHVLSIRNALGACEDLHAAPLTFGPLSQLTASLPAPSSDAPVREGRLISTAVEGVAVTPDTPLEEILRFRDDHAALRGRFRAAMADLSESLSRDEPISAALEEARAVIVNRVTPAVADLDQALSQSRIGYVWQALLAGGAVAAGDPIKAGVTTVGAGTFVTHSLAYTFKRDRLIAEHPYGFLREARKRFPAEATSLLPVGRSIVDPEAEILRLWRVALAPVRDALKEILPPVMKEREKLDKDLAGDLPPSAQQALYGALEEGFQRARGE